MSAKEHEYFLRPLEPKDAQRMLEWMHDEDVTKYLRLNGKDATEADALGFIKEAQNEQKNLHRAVVDRSGTYLGTISLKNIDHGRKEAEYAVAMHPSAIGTGAAAAATEKILGIGFQTLQLDRIYLNVLDDNIRAVRFYEKFGFQFEKCTDLIFQKRPHRLKWYSICRGKDEVMERTLPSPKLVFFNEKKQVIGGGLIFFLSLAREIARAYPNYRVFYVNYPNRELEEKYLDDTVTCCDITGCDFSQFEGAQFVVPLNYLFFLLEKIENLKIGKIFLFDWHPDLMRYLSNQFLDSERNDELFLSMLKQRDALGFMDQSCALSVNRFSDQIEFQGPYAPVFLSQSPADYAAMPLVGTDRIQLGWLGRLDPDKIHSLINLLEMLLIADLDRPVDLHIIGDGSARSRIQLHRYAPKIRFIFTSYLLGDARDRYIAENIDLMVAMGISALDTANLSVPTVIPIVSSRAFNNNQFVFLFDTVGYSLGWTKEDLKILNCKTHSIQAAIGMVYQPKGKASLGLRCHHFVSEHFKLEKSARLLLDAINQSSLSVAECRENAVVNRQLRSFGRYRKLRKNKGRTYGDYILFVQKINRASRKPLLGKGKAWLQICLNPVWQAAHSIAGKISAKFRGFQRRVKNLLRYRRVQESYAQKIENIKIYWKQNKKLHAAFLVMFNSVFPCEPIFEAMLQDDAFDPYIIVIPDMQRSLRHRIHTYQDSYDDLKARYGDRVLKGFDMDSDSYMELEDRYQLVFFNNPYSKMAHPYHHVTYFNDKNVLNIYVNYGFAAVKYGRAIIKSDFYNLLWKVCLDSEINFEDVKRQQAIRGRNALVTGYVKMDRLASAALHLRTRKRIIICPHHTVLGWKSLDISNFLSYYDFFIKLPGLYPDLDFVFRPHPLLFSNLIENNIWSQEEVEAYIAKIEKLPNMRYDNSGDYFELFANSDAMIHDCSSFIGEYLFTEKPCCYMLKSEQEIEEVLLPMGVACIEHYYKAFCKDDIIHFLNEVVIDGVDPLKSGREEFSRTKLKFNYPHSTQVVLATIKAALEMEEGVD